jgi:DNA polymerase-1
MLAAWVLDPLERIGLDEQALIHLEDDGKKVTKAAINPFLKKNGNRYDLVPWSVMEPYAKSDVELTLKLFEQQQERLDGEDSFLRPQCEFEIQEVMPVLVKMAQRGIGYNAARSKIEAARAMAAMSKIDRELPFRPATPAKARLWFFDHEKAIPHCVTEKTGVPSVGECCLRSLVAQQVPGADLYLTRTKYVNAVGKNYIGFAEATGADERLRTDLKQAGTVTMRFASKRVNLQSLPHDYKLERMEGIEPVRSLFQPKEGYELWEFDLAQAEARIAAQKAPCTTWLQFFTDGRDLHAETAVQLFGDSEFEHRQIGKRANFSLIYGVGPATFQRDLEKQTGIRLLDSEAKEVVYGWRKLYPEFGRINKMAEKSALKRKYVVLADGRQYWFRPFDEFHKAFNAYVQGSLAQFVKRWMVAVDEVFGEVLLQIHDSVVVEIREDQVKENVAGIIRVGGEMATRAFGVHMFAEGKKWN